MSDTKCPFGCDEPWPHAPGGCVIRLDDASWAELQRVLADPPKPNPKLVALMKHYREMAETLKREGSVDV